MKFLEEVCAVLGSTVQHFWWSKVGGDLGYLMNPPA
ncbi:unnamed protein product [Brassica oleracea]